MVMIFIYNWEPFLNIWFQFSFVTGKSKRMLSTEFLFFLRYVSSYFLYFHFSLRMYILKIYRFYFYCISTYSCSYCSLVFYFHHINTINHYILHVSAKQKKKKLILLRKIKKKYIWSGGFTYYTKDKGLMFNPRPRYLEKNKFWE